MSWPHCTKTHKKFGSLGTTLFQTRDLEEGPMEPAHLPNNTTFLLSKFWKFQFISCGRSKVIPFLLPDRHTDRHTDRQTDRQTDKQTHRHTDRHTDRQTHRQTDTQTDRHTYTHLASLCAWVRFFSIWNFIPFTTLQSFVCFGHSLTSFVKDKIEFKFKYVLFSESTPKPFRQPCVYILASLLWLLSKSLCEYCKLFY